MFFVILISAILIAVAIVKSVNEKKYKEMEVAALQKLGISSWGAVPYYDTYSAVKSKQALEKYDDIKFFKENASMLEKAEQTMHSKNEVATKLRAFLNNNEFMSDKQYNRLESEVRKMLVSASAYRVLVRYISPAGNNLGQKEIALDDFGLRKFRDDPSLLMGKGEYSKYLKEQQKEALSQKHREYYDRVNRLVDYASENRAHLVIKGNKEELDSLIAELFDRTVNTIKKIKTIDSEEWEVIGKFISRIECDIEKIMTRNRRVIEYYQSTDFAKIKETCEVLMSTQREFNEYINEKVEAVSKMFGTRIVRNETVNDDIYEYIRPYKKTITPFTAELSASVFASAENNPLEYIVKNFYPNKKLYPEQIQNLRTLVEELETLREAKNIIENYKKEYQQYLGDVPDYIMEADEDGFYTRLGFANISEETLTVEYKFVYTSGGGMAQRSFTVPMTEATIIELINTLESKLTAAALAKEQRQLMTKKLREFIKERDHHTCCTCGNSTEKEPNLLLEIDHIIPVSKGGLTEEGNLQTLCWKCNRSKSNKIIL